MLGVEWLDEAEVDMNYTHTFVKVVRVSGMMVDELGVQEDDVLVAGQMGDVLRIYETWRARDLRAIAAVHRIRVGTRDSARELREKVMLHRCEQYCRGAVMVFRTLRFPRGEDVVARMRRDMERDGDGMEGGNDGYLHVASAELRRAIIGEWQELMCTRRLKLEVCAVCGRRTKACEIRVVEVHRIKLELLRNDDLPARVYPTTYAFALYERALLHPKGMTDRWNLGDVRVCATCDADLCVRERMPKFAIANGLYYGHDEVPEDVKIAFAEATQFEKILIARARASKISFRFSELKGHALFGSDPVVSQRCVKGNVIVMPQDATELNAVLPPSPEIVRDTVCAVFVGQTKPTKETIRRLRPVLVRKSRVKAMITFLVESNIHYQRSSEFHGFSRTNLDLLFGEEDVGEDCAVPCAMEWGYLEESDAIRAATADYTARNESNVGSGGSSDGDELLMENVGYTDGDETPLTYRQMKMKALKHCLTGGRFLRSRAGSQFIPDFENPRLLSWLFPHLDPWGIGGFFEPTRRVKLTLEEQLSYLVQLDDARFASDPDFAFVYYNIRQKKAVCDSVNFRVKVAQQQDIVRKLLEVDADILQRMIERYERDAKYEPVSDDERQILHVLNQVRMVGRDLPGTAGYKVMLRNEIRSLVHFKGTPALFITLNPSDVNHPLVRLLAGENVSLEDVTVGEELTEWQRKLMAARNPVACAMFFHTMISAFVNVVLRHGRPGRGLFGKCDAYFGTVEAQGRGTLHCHMLIWLEGHPSPQKMRDMMVDSAQFQQDMFTWLESIIRSELLGTNEIVREPNGPLPRPRFEEDARRHPGTVPLPSVSSLSEDEFEYEFERVVNDLVKAFNWHEHTDTCWKYLRRSDPRDDAHCRMRIDGSTRSETCIDEETGSILLRRWHPRIANYNDVVMFLLQANMDIKHIGSGQGAKALLYYITDYITKASLPTHVGLSALLYAIGRASEKLRGGVDNCSVQLSRSALTTTVNRMLSRQEVSHAQVMSYLVGGGDHYASHRFRVLHFGAFDRMFRRVWEGAARDGGVSESVEDNMRVDNDPQREHGANETGHEVRGSEGSVNMEDEDITLYLGSGSISAVTQQQDYMFRSAEIEFAELCLYEFVGMVEKVTKRSEQARMERRRSESRARGRQVEVRGSLDARHPQHETHVLRKRTVWVVPVVLGDKMPRCDRGVEEKEQWARTMMMLFIPWRVPRDLKDEGESWIAAFERRCSVISAVHRDIMKNMNVLSECRDARDEVEHVSRSSSDGGRADGAARVEEVIAQVERVRRRYDSDMYYDELDGFAENGELGDVRESVTLVSTLDYTLGVRVRDALDRCYEAGDGRLRDVAHGVVSEMVEDDEGAVQGQAGAMKELKRKRRPEVVDVRDERRAIRPRRIVEAEVSVVRLQGERGNEQMEGVRREEMTFEEACAVIEQVIEERGLRDNLEQLRAFEIVAYHVCFGNDQLMMYIGGVGGTGKTYVVQAILRLFELLGRTDEVLIGAPTGAAARLIGGHTIHSLTMLPDSKKNKDIRELVRLWEGKHWMIADEISMVGGRFMSQWSQRMQQAKGDEGVLSELPFGGVNMIFLGDFGQLRPVKQGALYSYKLIRTPGFEACRDDRGVSALMGAYLWRCVRAVVLLRKNQRQSEDGEYAALLGRVRVGQCGVNELDGQNDVDVLRRRELSRLAMSDPDCLPAFHDAPVIVGRKKIRDLVNARLIEHHASYLKQEVHLYHSQDSVQRVPVAASLREELWRLPSSCTNDALGRLPLFPGMKVMIQENLAFSKNVVNGAEGVVKDIKYRIVEGRRVPAVVYVHIEGAGSVCDDVQDDVVPIFPEVTTFKHVMEEDGLCRQRSVSRLQLPLLPAYAYTDYKSQGRTLDRAIVDIESAQSIQGIYVMLSRVRSLRGIAVLRPFAPEKLQSRISEELRTEFRRLERLDQETATVHRAARRHIAGV